MKDIAEIGRNYSYKKKNNNISSDNDDIIKQLSQLTSNDDKSFESSLISKNIPYLDDINLNISEKNNNDLNNVKDTRNLKKNIEKGSSLIDKKHFPLNQKLKYLCSLIQIFNINIKKYDDLLQFNRYFSNDNLKPNQLEPINILFDIISELIFYIQRELKNNETLMEEIKKIKYIKTEKERLIYNLKSSIKDKDIELEKLRSLINGENLRNDLKEINELKNENKELYKKINNYKIKIQKIESINSQLKTHLDSINNKKCNFNSTLTKGLYNGKNICSLLTLNNSYENPRINITTKNGGSEKKYINLYYTKTSRRNNKYINFERNYSPLKASDNEESRSIRKNNENYNSNKNYNEGSIINNLKILLKEINNMLNNYNAHLEKINISNKDYGIDNIKYVKNFLKEMNNKIEKLENIAEINSNNNELIYKKSIQVNTSKWRLRKKVGNKNILKKINENIDMINSKKRNTSTNFRKDIIMNKLLN